MLSGLQASSLSQVLNDTIVSFQSLIAAKKLQIAMDIKEAAERTCSSAFAMGVRQVMEHAIARSPEASSIDICAVRTENGLELEIADSGVHQSDAVIARSAFDGPLNPVLASASPQPSDKPAFGCLPCPQGGLAWTLYEAELDSKTRAA